ncbi:Hpt domain-containing protein [bacterium RCC_150]
MFSSGSSEVNEEADSSPMASSVDTPGPSAVDLAEHPILDLAEFQLLEDQVDNPLIARAFAGDFAKLWARRYQILATAVERGNESAALDAILSLRTSSTMVGGMRLASLSAHLEEHLRNGDFPAARKLLKEIAECGRLTVQELRASYVLRNG